MSSSQSALECPLRSAVGSLLCRMIMPVWNVARGYRGTRMRWLLWNPFREIRKSAIKMWESHLGCIESHYCVASPEVWVIAGLLTPSFPTQTVHPSRLAQKMAQAKALNLPSVCLTNNHLATMLSKYPLTAFAFLRLSHSISCSLDFSSNPYLLVSIFSLL